MSGKEAAAILARHEADGTTAAKIERALKEQDNRERSTFNRY
jgi:hypothetical protein